MFLLTLFIIPNIGNKFKLLNCYQKNLLTEIKVRFYNHSHPYTLFNNLFIQIVIFKIFNYTL